jgi:tetratricopeptide (TPR) repeat protein
MLDLPLSIAGVMRSIFTNRSMVISISSILVLLFSGVLAVAQEGLGSRGVKKEPARPATPSSGTRLRRATAKRHNPSLSSSEARETTKLEKPAEATPVPGLEDKNAGIESYNKEEYDKAIERLSAARTLRPADAEIFYYLGDSYSAKKQHKEAIDAYQSAIKIDEKLATEGNYFNLGYAYEFTKNNTEALAAYRKALEKKNDNAETLTHVGDVSSKLKDWKTAVGAYEGASRLNPKIEDPDVYFNWGLAYVNSSPRQYEVAFPLFQKAIALNVENVAEAYFLLGTAAKKTGRFKEAVDAFTNQLAKKADDDNARWAYVYLGEIYSLDLPNEERALDAYKGAVRVNPKDQEAWFNLGIAQHNLNRHQDAAESYNQAVLLEPNNPDYRLHLGKAYLKLQRYGEAIEALNKAVEINPKLSEAYYYRGLSHRNLGQFEQAVESLNRSIENPFERRKDEGSARYILAESYFKLGKVDAARQQCDLLRSMGPDAPQNTAVLCK